MPLKPSTSRTRLALVRGPLVASALLLAGCAGEEAGPPVTVTDSAGVTVVENDHLQPEWTGETAWRLSAEPRLQVGNQPGDPTQRLYQAQHSRLLRNGGLVVASTGLGEVRIFDADGYHVRTLGFPADPVTGGPSRPVRVYELPGDSIFVLLADASITVFDPEGRRARTGALARPDDGVEWPPEPLGFLGDGSLAVRAYVPMDTTQAGLRRHRVRVYRYGLDGSLLGSFGEFDAEAELVGDGILVFGASGYQAPGDSTLWFGPGDRFELREVAEDGRLLRVVRSDLPGQPVSPADTFLFRKAAERQISDMAGDSGARQVLESYLYAETFPAYDQLIVDDVGNVWTRAYRWFDLGAEKLWTVSSPDGRLLGNVITPWVLEIHQIGDDFILGRMADQRGSEGVYLYGLEKPAAGAAAP